MPVGYFFCFSDGVLHHTSILNKLVDRVPLFSYNVTGLGQERCVGLFWKICTRGIQANVIWGGKYKRREEKMGET